jgi:uncharacterized membrane protein (UPF0127 family)
MIKQRVELNHRRLALLVDVCETPFERARGLLFRRRLRNTEALLIPWCHAVHTVGLWYALDLAFCSPDGIVMSIVRGLAPWHFARDGKAASVWELPAGGADALALKEGDRLTAQ